MNDPGSRTRIRMVLILLLMVPLARARTDPDTGRIRLLYVGQWPYGGRPQYLLEDPLLQTSIVPYYDFGEQLQEIRRYMHQRYPRTLHMVDNYDMVIYSNIQLLAFTVRQVRMVKDAVELHGFGYMMTGGHTSFGGTTDSYPSWSGTAIDDVLPVNLIDGKYIKPFWFPLRVIDPENELMRSLPWSEIRPFSYSLNAVTIREGSHLLAEADIPDRWPVLAYRDLSKGRTLGFMTPFEVADNKNLEDWGFFDDLCANIVYFGADIDLPDDPFMIHDLRSLYRDYHDQRLLLVSMIEFVDRFGVRTVQVEDLLQGVEETRIASYDAYIEQDFVASSELMDEALADLKGGHDLAIRIKDRALFWVYAIEWLVVTATLMATGSVLWTLMVRKRLYRATGTTRLL